MASFKIPKQTDRSLLAALESIRAEVGKKFEIRARTVEGPGSQEVVITADANPLVEEVLNAESHLMPQLWLRGEGNHTALSVERKPGRTDDVQVAHDNSWINQIPEQQRASTVVKLVAAARKHLRAVELDGTITGTEDTEWARYREAQAAILQGLQETQRTILTEFTRKSLEMRRRRKRARRPARRSFKSTLKRCKNN